MLTFPAALLTEAIERQAKRAQFHRGKVLDGNAGDLTQSNLAGCLDADDAIDNDIVLPIRIGSQKLKVAIVLQTLNRCHGRFSI
jgi:hypothetical protein